MKNKKGLFVAMAFALVSSSFSPLAFPYSRYYNSGIYFGGEIGGGNLHYTNNDFKNPDFYIDFDSIDDKGFAGRIYAGYNLNRNAALEIGFTGYENPRFHLFDTTTEFSQNSLDILSKVSLPITCDLSFHAKGGVAFVHRDDMEVHFVNSESSEVVVKLSDSDDHVRPVLGLGISYDFSSRISAEVDFMRTFGSGDLEDADFYGAGLTFRIG